LTGNYIIVVIVLNTLTLAVTSFYFSMYSPTICGVSGTREWVWLVQWW